MTTDVGIRIGVDGEKEFKSSLAAVNAQIKNLNSEMQSTVAAFAGMEESEEAVAASSDVLGRSLSAQQDKLRLLSGQYERSATKLSELEEALEAANAEFGENSKEASKAQIAYNRQAAEVNNLGSQINKTKMEVKQLERQYEDATTKLKAFEWGITDVTEELKDADNNLSGVGKNLKGAFAGGAVLGAVTGIADGIANIVEESLEYNKIMGTLAVSSQNAGYTADQTAASYTQLYGVIGDEQQSATALANLQALGLSQEELVRMTDAAIGAWATYGDSIPIDGLAEAINETIRVGQVTGTFADALNWAGTSEDDFNEKLAATKSESERVQLVLDELSRQGLPEAASGWRENNAELVKMNEANANLSAAMGELGLVFTPVVATFKNGLAMMITGFLDLMDEAGETVDMVREIGPNIVTGLWNGITSKRDWLKEKIKGWCSDVVGNFKQFFGIHSPSIVFRDTIGVMLMEGMAKGISDGEEKVLSAAQGINDKLLEEEERLSARLKEAGLTDAVKKNLENQLNSVKTFRSEYQSALNDIERAQSDLENKIEHYADKISSYGELFQIVRDETGAFLELGDLQEDIDAINAYGDALESLRERGVSDSLLSEIQGLDIGEATEYINQLMEMTDQDYQKYMALWEEKQKAAQKVASEYYREETEALKNEMLGQMEGYYSEFDQTGTYLMKGVAQGVKDGRSEVVNEVRRALEAAAAAAREAMEINSPSKVFSEIGDYMAQGVGQGFTGRMTDVTGDIAAAMPTREHVLLAAAGAGNSRSYSYGDINLFIDRVDNGNGRSIETLARELEFYRRQQTGGRGGRV